MIGTIAALAGRDLRRFFRQPSRVVGSLAQPLILWAVLGAIAGGILLNLMPCVFPILALKALHISRAGGSAKEARSDALAYTGGTIVGTGALGAILLAIRAAGAQAGWAFQLQDPRTIMLLLLLAIAAHGATSTSPRRTPSAAPSVFSSTRGGMSWSCIHIFLLISI